ncbi:MAG: ATP-binding cassette domain-containing protein [Pseudomonadota bacterium]
MLKASRLSKHFGATVALHELDLEVDRGEVLCLLGANGAGKTTTINLFLGFLDPTSGEARVDGLSVVEAPLETKAHLAYIPEQVALYPQLSGLENLEFFDRFAGHKHSREALLDFLRSAGLPAEDALRRSATYSKGMRQKVGIAIALAKNAEALLLDEPLSGLDPAAANSFCSQLKKMRDEGRAVLMATHDIFRAKEVGSRIGIMKAGRLVDLLEASSLAATEIEQIYLAHMHDEQAAVQ